jgi:hypothetical protein
MSTEYINFHGPDWARIKQYLEKKMEQKIGLLVGSRDHDESNRIRGSISMIKEILALENSARKADHQ